MAYGHNPFSEKTNWGGMLQDIIYPIAQMLQINKMYPGEQRGMKMPGAQTPMAPQAPPQAGMMGNKMMPASSPGGTPTQQPIGGNPMSTQTTRMGITQVPEARDIQSLLSMLPPQGQAILLSLLGSGAYKPPPQGKMG